MKINDFHWKFLPGKGPPGEDSSRGGLLPGRPPPGEDSSKTGVPKSAFFHRGRRVAEMPGRVGSGRAGTIPLFAHTLNNAALRAQNPGGIEGYTERVPHRNFQKMSNMNEKSTKKGFETSFGKEISRRIRW